MRLIPLKPSDVSWTDEQWEAIYQEGCNIIVSAGAGSGKTAVLTERVIRKLRDGVRINELLILTFTKAAAGEMKDRIRKKIKKAPNLFDNLRLIDSAYITTFDSFALSVVKKYHYLLNLSPDIGIMDANVIQIEKEKIMNDIFLEYYEDRNPLFLKMIDQFCVKDDVDLRNYILTISNKMDLMSNKREYLESYLSSYFSSSKIQKDILLYEDLIRDKMCVIDDLLERISYLDSEFSYQLRDSLAMLYSFSSYDDLVSKLNVKMPNAPKGSDEEIKLLKKNITIVLKEIKELARFKDSKEIENYIMSTYPTIQIMVEIILKFTDKVMEFKNIYHSYEFNDIAIMAIRLVKEYSIVRDELGGKFQEIMIDEYQDTNDLQEEFILMIAHHNTYMVGDIKQSIYRFRNANPYIFKSKYDDYSVSSIDKKIDLNKNFRSRKEVLDNINLMFILMMNDTIGGADYLKSHQMIFGNGSYLKDDVHHSNDMEVMQYEYDTSLGFTKEEIEAFMIAKDISDKVTSGYKVFDKDTGLLRESRYDDFAIIMDRATSFDLYKKIFNYFSIPVMLLKDEKMNEETDVFVVNNLIKLIFKVRDKKFDTEFKYLFVSIMRSFLYHVEDEVIFDYFVHSSFKESDLYQKCLKISKKISYVSIRELLQILILEFQYYEKYISLGNVHSGIEKMFRLMEMALSLEEIGYTVLDFSHYLDDLLKKGYTIEYKVPDRGTCAVKIMTIHKSKGLEYPVCYFCGLYKEFNISDLKERFLFDKNFGIVVPFYDEGIGMTIYKDLMKKNYIKEEISEKIRLFYVALTRAREKMILVVPSSDKRKVDGNETVLSDMVKLQYRSFCDMLDSIYFRISSKYRVIDVNSLSLSKDYNIMKKIQYEDKIHSENSSLCVEEIQISLPSVSLRKYSKQKLELIDKKEREIMDIGIKFHQYLEYIDLKNPDYSLIDNSFYLKKIKAFMQQDLLLSIQDATIYQEYEFMSEEDDVIGHGIIDLMLVYDDHVDIIDYKLKNVNDASYLVQLNGYYEFVRKHFSMNVYLYLYSILDEKFVNIK